MTITDRAREANDTREKTTSQTTFPWDKYESECTDFLTRVLGDDPGPCERLELGTKQRIARSHSYPDEIKRGPILVYYPEGHEVVAWLRPKGWSYGVVHRNTNPMEEVTVSPFTDLAGFGKAIGN